MIAVEEALQVSVERAIVLVAQPWSCVMRLSCASTVTIRLHTLRFCLFFESQVIDGDLCGVYDVYDVFVKRKS